MDESGPPMDFVDVELLPLREPEVAHDIVSIFNGNVLPGMNELLDTWSDMGSRCAAAAW